MVGSRRLRGLTNQESDKLTEKLRQQLHRIPDLWRRAPSGGQWRRRADELEQGREVAGVRGGAVQRVRVDARRDRRVEVHVASARNSCRTFGSAMRSFTDHKCNSHVYVFVFYAAAKRKPGRLWRGGSESTDEFLVLVLTQCSETRASYHKYQWCTQCASLQTALAGASKFG